MSVAERPVIAGPTYAARLAAAVAATESAGLDAACIGVGSDLQYLTGYAAMPLERLTMLVIRPGNVPFLIVPRLERGAAEAAIHFPLEIVAWEETADPYGMAVDGLPRGPQVAVSDTLLAMHLVRLQAAVESGGDWSLASVLLRDLRMIKDRDEVALLRLAAEAADRVVEQIAGGRLIGRTERDVAREVRERLVAEGHDESRFAIVGSGPNSASPHHDASDRVIEAGDPIVLDIGGSFDGYGSDITRTLWVTGGRPGRGPDGRFAAMYEVLREAQAAATGAVRPGVACETVDAAARDPITAAGYGEAFFHRTGHGIGLDGHEDPYIVAGNDLPLRAGMAFSVEPGIYFPGSFGARIEDIVVCGEDGPIVLDGVSRALLVVDG